MVAYGSHMWLYQIVAEVGGDSCSECHNFIELEFLVAVFGITVAIYYVN